MLYPAESIAKCLDFTVREILQKITKTLMEILKDDAALEFRLKLWCSGRAISRTRKKKKKKRKDYWYWWGKK